MLPTRVRDQPKQMPAVGMPPVDRQNPAIDLFGVVQPAGAMMCERRSQHPLHRGRPNRRRYGLPHPPVSQAIPIVLMRAHALITVWWNMFRYRHNKTAVKFRPDLRTDTDGPKG